MKTKRIVILCLLIFLLVVEMIALSYNYFFEYQFEMIGNNPDVTNYGEIYDDPGIKLRYRGRNVLNYKIEKNINNTELGKYSVKYIFGNESRERIVEVKDLSGPIIELMDNDITINYKEKYKEPGYKAIDNYDGDVTDKVDVTNNINTNKLGEYNVTYSIKDSSNNESVAVRKVYVDDIEKPKIKFKNKKNTYGIIGSKTNIKDYEATDNYDGNITDKVIIDGKVNNKKEGLYKINYKVTDSHNNEQIVTRTINIQSKNTLGIPVLMYHWFYDDTKGEEPGKINSHNYISKTELEKQLSYLKNENYYFLSWDELEDYIDGKIDVPRKSIILTDDDCNTSLYSVALPLLKKYQIKMTSFCIADKTNYQKYLNEKYIDFESHTNSMHEPKCHTAWFGAVMCSTYEEIYDDIALSIKKLGNNNAFAYPYGHHNETVIKALKDNGIRFAFTINEGRVQKGANKYLLPRVRISSWTDIDTYKDLVK